MVIFTNSFMKWVFWKPNLRVVGCRGGSRYVEAQGDSLSWKWKGVLVSWFRGFLVSCFVGVSLFILFRLRLLVSWFIGFLFMFLGFKVAGFLGFKVTKFQSFEVSLIPYYHDAILISYSIFSRNFKTDLHAFRPCLFRSFQNVRLTNFWDFQNDISANALGFSWIC